MNYECQHSPACPGCRLIGLSLPVILEKKQAAVAEAFKLFPELRHVPIPPCAPAPSQTAYRTRVKCAVEIQGKKALIGLFRRGTHQVVDVPYCRVIVPELLPIIDDLRLRIPTYNAPVLHLDVRWSVYQKQAHVTLVTRTPTKDKRLELLAHGLMQAHTEVAGVSVRCAAGGPVVRPLSGITELVAGSLFLKEKVGSFQFRLSPGSFFQASPTAARILQEKIASWCKPLAPVGHIVDLFAGTGLFAIGTAKYAKTVTAIESTEQAADDARESAALSGVSLNVLCMPAEKIRNVLPGLHPDIVILDPPRRGASLSVLTTVGAARPSLIAYVSCDPETLARDLNVLTAHGYRIVHVEPIDIFPLTDHVETAVLLEKIESVPRIRVRHRDTYMHVSEKPFSFQKPLAEYAEYPCLIHSPPEGVTGMVVHMNSKPKKAIELQYLALVKGIPRKRGNLPCRKKTPRHLRQTYQLLSVVGGYGLVRIFASSAARWDIPRQFWRIGHPVLGDEKFGDRRTNTFLIETCGLHRMWLHLHRVTIPNPDGGSVRLCMPLPPDLRFVMRRIKRLRNYEADKAEM